MNQKRKETMPEILYYGVSRNTVLAILPGRLPIAMASDENQNLEIARAIFRGETPPGGPYSISIRSEPRCAILCHDGIPRFATSLEILLPRNTREPEAPRSYSLPMGEQWYYHVFNKSDNNHVLTLEETLGTSITADHILSTVDLAEKYVVKSTDISPEHAAVQPIFASQPVPILEVMCPLELAQSSEEARRLVIQNAVRYEKWYLDEQAFYSHPATLEDSFSPGCYVIRVGQTIRRFKVIISDSDSDSAPRLDPYPNLSHIESK